MKTMMIENEDYEVDWENNYLFCLIKPPFLNRQGKLGDFPDLAKLVSDFRNKSCAIVKLGTKDVLYCLFFLELYLLHFPS
jgi:hypothetical protein